MVAASAGFAYTACRVPRLARGIPPPGECGRPGRVEAGFLPDIRETEQPGRINSEVFLCVEMTDACDLRCIMCDQSLRALPHGSGRGAMDTALWRRLIDSLAADGVRLSGMAPHWLGESMIHPQFPPMVRYAFEKNAGNRIFGFFSMNTNGKAFAGENAAAILDCASRTDQDPATFRQVFISVDASTEETFARIKGKKGLSDVERNVEAFLAAQAERGLEFPRLIVKMIVMPENRAEAGAFLGRWSAVFSRHGRPFRACYDFPPAFEENAVFFDKLVGGDPAAAERLHREAATELGLVRPDAPGRIIKNDEAIGGGPRRPCPALWKTPMVRWDGMLTVCCNDTQMHLRLGNLADEGFAALWTGPKVEALREAHARGDFGMEPCVRCPNQRYPVLTDEDIAAWRRARRRT